MHVWMRRRRGTFEPACWISHCSADSLLDHKIELHARCTPPKSLQEVSSCGTSGGAAPCTRAPGGPRPMQPSVMMVRLCCCISSLTAAAAAAATITATAATAAAAAARADPAAAAAYAGGGPSAPMRMRVEYMDRPLGVDVCGGGGDGTAGPTTSPLPLRFTWSAAHTARQQRQTAYQLVVAAKGVGSCSGDGGHAIVWDSGTVRSNVSQNVPMGSGRNTSSSSLSPSAQLLAPARAYCWGVRWWDASGVVSPWSYSSFSTGLFTEVDWHGAAWLGAPARQNCKWQIGQFRKNFTVRGPVARATAYVVGLGYYQLHLNGKPVSRHELGTFTTFDRRVMYDTLDVTEAINGALAEPEHVLGLTLGNGWYNLAMTDPFDGGHPINIGPPTLRVRLSLQYLPSMAEPADNVVTDTSWMHTPGPTTFAHIFMGTVYNASRETPGWTRAGFVPGADWAAAEVVLPPSDHVILSSHAVMPQIRTTQRLTPCQMWQSSPGVFVYDFCQNMAGYATLRVPDGVATEPHVPISMVHAEAIRGPPANHSAIFNHFYRGKQTVGGKSFEMNTYVTRGDGAAIEWSPRFTYAGFRYVQLTGYPGTPDLATLTAHFISTANEEVGSIVLSDGLLNAIQRNTRASARSNFQHIPTDCPQRERRGWLGDAQISAETQLHMFDMAAAYTAFVRSISDAQKHVCRFFNRTYCEAHGGYGVAGLNGTIPDVVPFYGHGRQQGDPAWGAAYTLLPDWLDSYYRDDRLFSQHYAGIVAHLDQLIHVASINHNDGLLTFGLYSDWCPPAGCSGFSAGTKQEDPSGLCPPASAANSMMVSSFYYITQLKIVIKWAQRLGFHADAARFAAVLAPLPAAFNKHYFLAGNTTHKATYMEPHRSLSPQMAISLAYHLGVIPANHTAEVIQSLVDDIAAHGYHHNVGIVGVKFLFPALAQAGRGDVALMIHQVKTPPSYGFMVEEGATTLWETWYSTRYDPGGTPRCEDGCGVPSWNHIMYGGGTTEYYFKHLAGIQQQPHSRGWSDLVFKPTVWIPARNQSICANLSSAKASLVTSRGLISAEWSCQTSSQPPPPPSPYPGPAAANSLCEAGSGKLGGNVGEQWDAGRHHEVGSLILACTDGNKMTRVEFASYGWPTGNCSAGFHTDASRRQCDAKATEATVAEQCVGKSTCTLIAGLQHGDTPGSGPDPCINCIKSLAVVLSGCEGTSHFGMAPSPSPPKAALFRYDVTVPLGSIATVYLPMMGLMTSATIRESGDLLWSNRTLVPGVSGVLAAQASDEEGVVVVTVGSGAYSFKIEQ